MDFDHGHGATVKQSAIGSRHLLLHLPDDWTNDQKGDFFERFVTDLLKPMRYEVRQRLRVTGMEIDLLAKGLDQPRTILVECKAQRDALPADTISKLLGNVTLRGADAGWLFSTSDLSKDGRGQWEEIERNPELARRFMWYPPERLIDILIDQSTVVDPSGPMANWGLLARGDATLVCSPGGRNWLIEIIEDGLPAYFTVLAGTTGNLVSKEQAKVIASASDRFASLQYWAGPEQPSHPPGRPSTARAPVARVVAGDAWDDLGPARPIDFVGRDDVIQEVLAFIAQVRDGATPTRTFAVQGPSGWGKSSLVLKLSDLAIRRRRLPRCSFTAVDSRSATNAAFVSNALRLSFTDAAQAGVITDSPQYEISSLTHPLDSPDLLDAVSALSSTNSVIVLVFDQFEELFTKESLFETFNAIRELSLELDSRQIPVVLGFAWKTDISLPQQHPAYHLWHGLADRRRDFRLRQFGSPDIGKVISRAEREIGMHFLPALRTRLVEQCQGYPWLLKKLLVHVGQRLKTTGSQYVLLDRELDVEVLFKEDVAGLKPEQLRCLKHVAERAPAYVSEVEDYFKPDITNSLLSRRLLVRSGLNYVVYWDIFRDYLTEGRVPQIPWARTFQRDPRSAVLAAQAVHSEGSVSAGRVAKVLNGTERGCVNVMSDLVALQIVDRTADDQYKLASHIKSTAAVDLAQHMHAQLARHIVCRELASYDRDTVISVDDLEAIVRKMRPDTRLSDGVVHQYAMNLKRWLLFAGHLEERGALVYRAVGRGAQMGVILGRRSKALRFLGSGTPDALLDLLRRVSRNGRGVPEQRMHEEGLRNALYDALALQMVVRGENRSISLAGQLGRPDVLQAVVKRTVLLQPSTQIVATARKQTPDITNAALGDTLRAQLKEDWKPTSGLRYAAGLKRFYVWARS